MRYSFIHLLTIALIVSACNSQQGIVPGLKFGQTELEWRQTQNDLVKEGVLIPKLTSSFDKDTFYLFNWELADTSYVMRVYLNGDANKEGSLRMYSLRLTDDSLSKTRSKGKIEEESSGFTFYSQSTVDDLKRRLSSEYGQQDSTSISDGDTSVWYREKSFDLEIQIPKPQQSTTGLIYNAPKAFVYSKTYSAEYEKFMADKRSSVKVNDLLSIDFNSPSLKSQRDEYGSTTPILEITSFLESSPSHLNDKPVTSAKGTLSIRDNYNDVLLELEDQEYVLSNPLCCGQSWIIQNSKYGWNLSLANRPETQKLREALQRRSVLKAEFKPKVILFADGTVFR